MQSANFTVQKLEDAWYRMRSEDGQTSTATSLALEFVGFSLGFLFWVANTGFLVIIPMLLPGFGMRRAKGTTHIDHPALLLAGTLPGPPWGCPLLHGHEVSAEIARGSAAEAKMEQEQIEEGGTAQEPCRSHAHPIGCQELPRGMPEGKMAAASLPPHLNWGLLTRERRAAVNAAASPCSRAEQERAMGRTAEEEGGEEAGLGRRPQRHGPLLGKQAGGQLGWERHWGRVKGRQAGEAHP